MHYERKMYNNTMAYLEQIQDNSLFMFPDTIYFMMAVCCGKRKDYKNEEHYYRQSIELFPEQQYARNNLGYCLYKQGKYWEAKSIFEDCLEAGLDLQYVPNNYVSTLLAMNLNRTALSFSETGKYKISKSLIDKIKRSDGLDHPGTVVAPVNDKAEPNETNEGNQVRSQLKYTIPAEQFSSEKLLEDELTARIEAGIPVFGLRLKVWRRKGEYGRQYILPNGKRLDLFCEDAEGNLYIIELKKDSGYDDPYQQTAEYVDWFESQERFQDKKVYGIICLNSPTQYVLDNVHKDERIRLFEYQISYTER